MPETPRATKSSRRPVLKELPSRKREPASTSQPGAREAQPFLKWAGGKSQLLEQFAPFFPAAIQRYLEPFVGGGAVFFHLKARFPAMEARLCDNNAELINCYQVVRDDVPQLMARLDAHVSRFRLEQEPYFYHVRRQHRLEDPVERAARMIFLNKTCYNGLWRVNSRGEFNVPRGSYPPEKVTLYDGPNLLAASRALKETDLRVQDFRQTIREAAPGQFLYMDPPYFPLSRTANFTSYTKDVFGEAEQKELSELFADASRRGVRLMLSNSDTPFVRQLYAGHTIHTVQARRAVNCDGSKRGRIAEVVVLSR